MVCRSPSNFRRAVGVISVRSTLKLLFVRGCARVSRRLCFRFRSSIMRYTAAAMAQSGLY